MIFLINAEKHINISALQVLVPGMGLLIYSIVDKVALHPWCPYGSPQDLRVLLYLTTETWKM